ncbi:MAG: phage-shock protein [Thermodesulfobacteriota bacterium]
MHMGSIIALLVFGFPIVVVGGLFLVWALKIAKGHKEDLGAEETRLIQEIHMGLTRMEERIEALETILLDRERKEDKK